ncbi:MAG TPA: VOC family protein [Burkholderiaceae bacterium]|nr:VOC family protein [Burkholderiaceae bacterium]
MIGYVTFGTNDLARARAFYDALLGEVGIQRIMEFGERGSAWGAAANKPALGVMTPYDKQPATAGNGTMVAIAVDSKDKVQRLHAKALALGGKDEGAPGPRGGGFYAAYFRDLDGNKLNAFFIERGA